MGKKYGLSQKGYYYSPHYIYLLPNEELLIIGVYITPDSIFKNKAYGFALKTDKNGNQKWLKEYTDGTAECTFRGLILCSDSTYLFSGYSHNYDLSTKKYDHIDAFFVKTDDKGNTIWQRTIGDKSNAETILSGIEVGEKEYLFIGNSSNNSEGFNYLILKLNNYGQQILSKSFGSGIDETYLRITSSGSNQCLIAGAIATKGSGSLSIKKTVLTKIDNNGEIIWEKIFIEETNSFEYSTLLQISDGSIVAIGSQNRKPHLCGLTKFDKEGNIKWHRNFKHQKNLAQYVWDGCLTNDKGFIISGAAFQDTTKVGIEGWLLKLDSLGCLVPGCATSTSTEEISAAVFFSIFPNPSSDKINIAINKENHEDFRVELLDIQGRILFNTKILAQNSSVEIDVNRFVSGMYFIKIYNSMLQTTQKIIINH